MSFNAFLQEHQALDFAWEIFKGIAPTIIAFVTIFINTWINKNKTKKEELSKQIKEIQLMVSELSTHIYEVGMYMLDSIQYADDKEKSDKLFKEYENRNNSMLMEARKLLMYINIRAEIWNAPQINFTDICDKITKYSYEILDILKWYNQKAPKTPKIQFDDLCDEVQKKLIDSTTKIEGILYKYCTNLKK